MPRQPGARKSSRKTFPYRPSLHPIAPSHIPACRGSSIDPDTGRPQACGPWDEEAGWRFNPDPVSDPKPWWFNVARSQLPEGAPLCAVLSRASRLRRESGEFVPRSSSPTDEFGDEPSDEADDFADDDPDDDPEADSAM